MHPVAIDWDDGTKTHHVKSWEGIFPHHPAWVREGVFVSGPDHREGEICVGPPLASICWNDGTRTHNVTDWNAIHLKEFSYPPWVEKGLRVIKAPKDETEE